MPPLLARLAPRIPRLAEAGGSDTGSVAGRGEPLRLLVFGDSSAAGVGATDHREALAGQAAGAIGALTGRAISWRVVARTGATARTARHLVDQITDPHTRWTPDVMLVAVGGNDVISLRRPDRFRQDVEDLVALLRRRAGTPVPVLLAGLPPIHRFPALPAPVRWMCGRYASRLDRRLAQVARRQPGIAHLPVSGLPVRPDFFATDGFHPGPVGYRAWALLLAAQAASVLETLPTRDVAEGART
ncbi:SGNH/GDSL hydrolase family protein [Plantactinospora sp. GCM10030261]|uniref:SGNH/GDSL hydrolase family protein n=1 Tax=Plantactinospora sp. GCM10030261 TaxID=3273420 RepID=UPI00360AD22C